MSLREQDTYCIHWPSQMAHLRESFLKEWVTNREIYNYATVIRSIRTDTQESSSNRGLGSHRRLAKPWADSHSLAIVPSQPSAPCLLSSTHVCQQDLEQKGESREEKGRHGGIGQVNKMCKVENSVS